MKAHDLAHKLLAGPNVPVIINGWGSSEGSSFQVNAVSVRRKLVFNGAKDTAKTKRDAEGCIPARPCVFLDHCGDSPPSKQQKERERKRKEQVEKDRKTLTPGAFQLMYAEVKMLSPSQLLALARAEENKS